MTISGGDLAWSGSVEIKDNELLVPWGSIVLIRRDDDPEKEGSIVIPEKHRSTQQHGIVIAVGPGRRSRKTGLRETMIVKPGDRVMFNGHVASLFRHNENIIAVAQGDLYLVLLDDDEAGVRA